VYSLFELERGSSTIMTSEQREHLMISSLLFSPALNELYCLVRSVSGLIPISDSVRAENFGVKYWLISKIRR